MKIAWDVSKSVGRSEHSGLLRVARSLGMALAQSPGVDLQWVAWHRRKRVFQCIDQTSGDRSEIPYTPTPADWWITAEVFSEREKPGITHWLDVAPCKTAALFHDLIPLQYPEITWPKSVRRHPDYLRLLTHTQRLFSVSTAGGKDLADYARDHGLALPPLKTLHLGCFPDAKTGISNPPPPPPLRILCVAILEPRKNQNLLLDALETLWGEGHSIEAVFCGRVNPHFGKPIRKRIRALQKRGLPLTFHENCSDSQLQAEYRSAHLTVIPSIAEGAGLPLLESIGSGTPVLCSDLPSLMEYGNRHGCRYFPKNDRDALTRLLRDALLKPDWLTTLQSEVATRSIRRWEDTARDLVRELGNV